MAGWAHRSGPSPEPCTTNTQTSLVNAGRVAVGVGGPPQAHARATTSATRAAG
jgi:hypothetical protein